MGRRVPGTLVNRLPGSSTRHEAQAPEGIHFEGVVVSRGDAALAADRPGSGI